MTFTALILWFIFCYCITAHRGTKWAVLQDMVLYILAYVAVFDELCT